MTARITFTCVWGFIFIFYRAIFCAANGYSRLVNQISDDVSHGNVLHFVSYACRRRRRRRRRCCCCCCCCCCLYSKAQRTFLPNRQELLSFSCGNPSFGFFVINSKARQSIEDNCQTSAGKVITRGFAKQWIIVLVCTKPMNSQRSKLKTQLERWLLARASIVFCKSVDI